jgi:Rhs element Vgr protein
MSNTKSTSPTQAAGDGVVSVTVLSNGRAIADTVMLISVTVNRAINEIPSAQIVVRDGDIATSSFAASDAATFAPGAVIKISAGYGGVEETVFEGIVVKHGIRITGDNDSQLLIECQDSAVRMTAGNKSANFTDQSDSDIISALIAAHGLNADVKTTPVVHRMVSQHRCTDWDFMLARAYACGLLVMVRDGTVSVKAPDTQSTPTLRCAYGVDLIEFHAEIDARTQWASAQAFAWDATSQRVLQGDAVSPSTLNAQGNLDSKTLATVMDAGTYRLPSGAPKTAPELKILAESFQLRAGLARIRGRMRFQGNASVTTGGLIEVSGVGARLSGQVFVSSFTHKITDGTWLTDVDFGLSAPSQAAPAHGARSSVEGLQIGVVTKLEDDPAGESRIAVTIPLRGAGAAPVWARLALPHASQGTGLFFVPEIGDEVVLAFFDNDPSYPVIIGSLFSRARPAPYSLADANQIKALVTRSGTRIEFNDEDKAITVKTPGGNRVVVSDKDATIRLADQHRNEVALTSAGIRLDSQSDIAIRASGNLTIEALGKLDVKAQGDLTCTGLNIACEANVKFTGQGNATAELSSTGQTVVKGAMVMIN